MGDGKWPGTAGAAVGAGGWIRRCCGDDAEVEVAVGVAVMEEPAVDLVENGVWEEAGLIDCQR